MRASLPRLLLAGLLTGILAGVSVGCGKAAPRDDLGAKDFQDLRPNPGRASVVFLREWRFFEASVAPNVFEDKSALVGAVGNGCYRVRQAPPGDHVYWAVANGEKAVLPLSLREGDIVYVVLKLGDDAGPPSLQVVADGYAKPRIADMPGQCVENPYKNWLKR